MSLGGLCNLLFDILDSGRDGKALIILAVFFAFSTLMCLTLVLSVEKKPK